MKIPYNKNLIKNLEKYPAPHDHHPCCLCGKPVPEPFKYVVHEHDGGGVLVTEEEAENLPGNADMGMQPVGSDCWRKHPEIHKYGFKVPVKGKAGKTEEFSKK